MQRGGRRDGKGEGGWNKIERTRLCACVNVSQRIQLLCITIIHQSKNKLIEERPREQKEVEGGSSGELNEVNCAVYIYQYFKVIPTIIYKYNALIKKETILTILKIRRVISSITPIVLYIVDVIMNENMDKPVRNIININKEHS